MMYRKTHFVISILVVLMAGMLLFTGCNSGNSDKNSDGDYRKDGFKFSYNGTDIYMQMNMKLVLPGLGDYEDYFESTSCAFEGLDKEYQYAHFIVYTYPDKDQDYVSQVVLRDDLVATPEGVAIGDERAKVLEKYGENYQDVQGNWTYSKGNSKLLFLFDEDNTVTSIQYSYA